MLDSTSRAGYDADVVKLAVILALLAGCQDRAPKRVEGPPPTREIDELRALGYLAFTESAPPKTGVLRHDPKRSQPGYTFYPTRVRCRATLIDASGNRVHTWQVPGCRGWDHVELLDNGHLLGAARRRPRTPVAGRNTARDRILLELSRESKIVWQRDLAAHHDAVEIPDGGIATLTSEARSLPRVHRRTPVRDDRVTVLDGESFSLFDVLAKNDIDFSLQPVAVSRDRGNPVVDLLHTNAIEWLAGDRVLVCMRHQDAVALIDAPAKRLLWAWGQGELSGPHDATHLASGNVLIFDNGLERKRSRVLEVDPRTDNIVWQYGWGDDDLEFFTRSHGSAQRLQNGNTLIGVSDSARALEITTSGDVVWEFYAPAVDSKHATINRVRRYDTRQVEGWLRP